MNHRPEGNGLRLSATRLAGPALTIAATLTLVAQLSLVAATRLEAQQGTDSQICDPDLESRGDDPRAYQLRGDRCEGIFRLKVNSDKVRLRSWTAWFEDYDDQDPTPLRVTWSVPPGTAAPVRLRVDTFRPRTFYRMDTLLAPSGNPWSWPTQFLGQLQLGRADIGIVGWTKLPLASDDRLYLPLEVQQHVSKGPDGYRAVLVPGERLQEILWNVAPALEDGTAGSPFSEPEPLGYGYYPAQRPTVFTVPAPAKEGLYVLHLQAISKAPEPATRDVWFYHPGPGGASPTAPGAGAGVRP